MPDYTSILERSIETLPEKTPDMRQAVYERARAALARQLTSVDPPLSPESIELQHQHLEDAILAVEAEFPLAAGGEGAEPAEDTANGEIPAEPELAGEETLEWANVPDDLDAPAPEDAGQTPQTDESAPPGEAQIEPEPSNKRWEQPKVSHAPVMIMAVLFALIAAGAAVFAFTQWDSVQAFISDLTGRQTVAGTKDEGTAGDNGATAETAGGGVAEVPKAEDRLLEGITAPLEAAQATQPDAAPMQNGETEVAGETMDPVAADSGGTQLAETPAADAPATDVPASGAPATDTPAGTETAADEPPASEPLGGTETVDAVPQGLVGQRAIFEEQGAEGAPGKSVAGVVAWSQKARENGPPAIVGVIELPDRNAAMSLTITKNTDPALPASHLIEIEFRGADGLIESPLERVPALFAKKTAQSRGQRLAGEAVPVTDNLYWIALSDQGDQVSRNLTLLREGAWFGMPMLFKNGRGALVNFEKGIPGDQIFESVLLAWEKPNSGQ